MSARIRNPSSSFDMRPPIDTEMKRTEIDEVAEVKVTFNTRVRNRLEQLLGTDMLRLNDRQYMRTLMRRIYEDQEHCLQKRTETRQMQENKRLKGLVEDMKMEKPPDMVETAFVVSFKKTKTAMEKVQKKQFNKRHNIRKRKTVSCAELDSDDETSPEVEDITTNERYHNSSFLGTTLDLSAEEDDSLAEERRQRELAQLAIKFGRYKEPLVQLLLQEGTVPRLYDLAEIILVKPPKLQKKKKAATGADEETGAEAEPDEPTSDSAEEGAGTDGEEDEGEEEETEDAGAEKAIDGDGGDGGADQSDGDDAGAEGESPAEGETPGSEATDGGAPGTSEDEDSRAAPEDSDAAGTRTDGSGTEEEVSSPEAEAQATATEDRYSADEAEEAGEEASEGQDEEEQEMEEGEQHQEEEEGEEEEGTAGGGSLAEETKVAEPAEDKEK